MPRLEERPDRRPPHESRSTGDENAHGGMLAAGPSKPVGAPKRPRPYDGPMRGPELPTDDLYARLELPPDAAPEAIEIAWRALLKVHHPDVAGEASLEIAKRINIAHDWLADPDLRARYDRSRGGRRAVRPAASRSRPPQPPRRTRTADLHDHVHEGRPRDVGLGSEVIVTFLDRVSALGADEIDRLALAAPPPLAFVASIRRFLGRERLTALEGLEALVAHRLPARARAVPAAHDAVTSYGQYLVLEGFLGDLLSEPFLERVEERMTRGWLAAVGRTRYGPRTADVRALVPGCLPDGPGGQRRSSRRPRRWASPTGCGRTGPTPRRTRSCACRPRWPPRMPRRPPAPAGRRRAPRRPWRPSAGSSPSPRPSGRSRPPGSCARGAISTPGMAARPGRSPVRVPAAWTNPG